MIRTIHTPSPEVEKLAYSALAILTQDVVSAPNCPQPEASDGAVDRLQTCAGLDELATTEPLGHARQAVRSLAIAVDDWDLMFRAVEERLRIAVGERLVATPGLTAQDAACPIQGIVLECVLALDQLHMALNQERDQRVRLELEIADAQAALARALTDFLVRRPERSVFAT